MFVQCMLQMPQVLLLVPRKIYQVYQPKRVYNGRYYLACLRN